MIEDDTRRGPGRRLVRVRSSHRDRLLILLRRHGFCVESVDAHELQVDHTTAEEVGLLARFFDVPLHHLYEVRPPHEQPHHHRFARREATR